MKDLILIKESEAERRESELHIFLSYIGERMSRLVCGLYSDQQIRQELKEISFRIDKELLK